MVANFHVNYWLLQIIGQDYIETIFFSETAAFYGLVNKSGNTLENIDMISGLMFVYLYYYINTLYTDKPDG